PAGAAATIARPDRSPAYRSHITFRQIRRRAVTHVFSVAVQKKNGTTQSFRLAFHEKNKAGENIRQRRIGSDHFQNPTLPSAKKFFLFELSYVSANDHTTETLSLGTSQGTTIDPNPKPPRRLLAPDEFLNIIYFLAAN